MAYFLIESDAVSFFDLNSAEEEKGKQISTPEFRAFDRKCPFCLCEPSQLCLNAWLRHHFLYPNPFVSSELITELRLYQAFLYSVRASWGGSYSGAICMLRGGWLRGALLCSTICWSSPAFRISFPIFLSVR